VDAAVEKAVEAATGDVEGLKQKVEDLIGDNKKLKGELRKSKEIDPAEVERLHAEVEELQGKLTAAEKAAKDANTAKEKAEKALEAESGFTHQLLIQDGIKSALIANGVKDEDFLDTLSAKFAKDAKVVVDGDKREAKIGDKSLADHFKEWAGSDAGKKFVSAASNSGGGAPGGKTGESGKKVPQSEFDAMKPKDRAAFMADGGSIAEPA
jgi:hypothetical protein